MVGLLFIFQNLVCLFITGYVIVKIIGDIYDITINGIKCNIKTVTIFFQVDEYKSENIKNMKNMINIHKEPNKDISHMRQLMNQRMILIFAINTSRHIAMYTTLHYSLH